MSVFVDITPEASTAQAAPVRGPAWRGVLTRAALPVLSVLVFLVGWQLAAASGIWNQTFVPYPATVWHAFIDVSTTHDGVRGYAGYLLYEHLYMTLRRVLAGVVIGVSLGVLLGLVMGSIGWVRSVLEPWLTFLRALPPDERARRLPRTPPSASVHLGAHVELSEPTPGRFRLALQPTVQRHVVEGDQVIHYAERTTGADQRWQRLPVSGISWDDAVAYADWLARTGRLPGAQPCGEREWERAARGADDRLYPHGDALAPDDADLSDTYGHRAAAYGPDEVGAHPASDSPFGVADLAGNVWEWVRSVSGDEQVAIRGGSWYHNPIDLRSTNREPSEPSLRSLVIGARICAPAPREPDAR